MRFLSIEKSIPSHAVSNEEILKSIRQANTRTLGNSLPELEDRVQNAFSSCGTTVRYYRAKGETAHDLCMQAGLQALSTANIAKTDVDLLIYVGIGRGMLEPATANIFQDSIGLVNATCFDILDACASWLRAVEFARLAMSSGRYKCVMILNGEFGARDTCTQYELKHLAQYDSWYPSLTISEAATATILTHEDSDEDQFYVSWETNGGQAQLCHIALPNIAAYAPHWDKTGSPLEFISYGSELLACGIFQLIAQYGADKVLHRYEPNIVFGHAASDGASRLIAKQCNLANNSLFLGHHRFGNMVSASLPVAMATALEEGRLASGHSVLILVGSAGVTTGIAKMQYLD